MLRQLLRSCKTIAEGIQPNGTAADNAGFLFALAKTKALRFFEKNPASRLKINNQHIEWQPQYNYIVIVKILCIVLLYLGNLHTPFIFNIITHKYYIY